MVYVLAAAAAAILIALIVLYNQLISRRQMVNNGWADIDVQLKRRADLVPQLVRVVEGYADHETQLFTDIAEKRSKAMTAGDDPARRGQAEAEFAQPVSRLIAVAEAYPELKASQNFLDLQHQLTDTENKIEMARRFYNGAVRELNTSVESFPSNLVAPIASVSKREFFNAEEGDRTVPSSAIAKP